jgi:hypothetical protein
MSWDVADPDVSTESEGRPEGAPDGKLAPIELRARRFGIALVIAISVAFIGASSWQIVPAVFGARVDPIPASDPGSPEGRCAAGVRSLLGALERAGREGRPASRDGDEMAAALRARLSPEWEQADAVREACSASPQGEQAWAALERMKMAEEQPPRVGQDALAVLRVEVAQHLPPDLR